MNRLVVRGLMVFAAALLLTPVTALGAASWTAVTVNQTQDGWSPHHQLDLQQTATISSETRLDNQANIQASATGTQGLWVTGRAHQEQDLSVGTRLRWDDNTWPANAVGTSSASLDQQQQGWSNSPMSFSESGGVWLRNRIGNTHSNADATVSQTNIGARGDASQSQSLHAQGRVEGHVDPPFPTWQNCHSSCHSSFGGRLLQRVNVIVENLFTF